MAGLAGRAPSTKGTYRSALYRLAEAMHGPAGQRATPFPGARAPAPYSPAERAELAALAAAQRDPVKRASALAMIVFGIGAGLRPGELVALRGGDVIRHGRQVTVHITGPAARAVPVTSRYADRAGELARHAGSDFVFRPGPAERGYKNFVNGFARNLAADPAAAALSTAPRPVQLRLRPPGRGHPGPGAARGHRDRRGRVAGPLCQPRRGHQLLQGRPAGPLARGDRPVTAVGLALPPVGGGASDATAAFAAELIDRSGKAPVIEAALAHRTGRRRPLPVRAVLTALLCLALDDRPLFLTEATRLLFCQLSPASRRMLGVPGTVSTERAFQAAYRRVRYCSGAICSVMDPSPLPKNRRLTGQDFTARTRKMTPGQAQAARGRLEAFINALIEASLSVLADDERAASDGSAGWTPPRSRCSPAARPSGPGCAPATPTAAGTSAKETTASARTTRASRCARSPGRWKPPSPPPPACPAPHPPAQISRSAWPWPGPARTPAAPAPACWPPWPPAVTSPAPWATTAPTPRRSPSDSTSRSGPWATSQSWTTAPTSSASRQTPAGPSWSRAPGTAPPSRTADHRHHPPARPRHQPRPLRPADHRPPPLPAQAQRRPRHRRIPAAVLPRPRPPPRHHVPAARAITVTARRTAQGAPAPARTTQALPPDRDHHRTGHRRPLPPGPPLRQPAGTPGTPPCATPSRASTATPKTPPTRPSPSPAAAASAASPPSRSSPRCS